MIETSSYFASQLHMGGLIFADRNTTGFIKEDVRSLQHRIS